MIIVRSPLRITLGGGGTDLPSYYSKHGGLCLAAAIDKYVYITLHETFVDDLIVKYSEMERVRDASEVKHPIIRETLAMLGIDGHGLEIASHADIPAGTGLGSSSAFTCALIGALHTWAGDRLPGVDIAYRACCVELERLKEPIGKQDQYISALGGIRVLEFCENDNVIADPLKMIYGVREALEQNLLLFFTGYSRIASEVLAACPPSEMDLECARLLAQKTKAALRMANMREFATLLSRQWDLKRSRSKPNPQIDEWYDLGMRNGAIGGKLVGAGGGGFLMFYAEDSLALRQAMQHEGLREMPFKFDDQGTTVVCS